MANPSQSSLPTRLSHREGRSYSFGWHSRVRRALASLIAGVMLGGACDRGDEERVFARVGGYSVEAGDLARVATVEDRRRSLDAAIARVLASQEAAKRGIAEKDLVRRRVQDLRRAAAVQEQALLRDALFASIRDGLEPTEADLRSHYATTKLRYAEREVTLRWWSFDSQRAARSAVEKSGAVERRDAASAETIGPRLPRSLPAKVVPEVFHLTKVGDRLAAGSEAEGFGVVELVEVLPAVAQPFEAVRDRVEESWRTLEGQRAFAKLLAELREKADIEIDEVALADDALWQAPEGE